MAPVAMRLVALALPTCLLGIEVLHAQTTDIPMVGPAPLSVTLTSGRTFTGQVDPRTSDEALVLRFSRGGAFLRRTIEWNRIAAAALGEQPVPMAELRAKAEELRIQETGDRGQESGDRGQGTGDRGQETGDRGQETGDRGREERIQSPLRVTSITFDARLANWDGDVEADGLLIDVLPLDRDQSLVPVGGTVEVELFAPQRRVFQHAPQSYGATLDRVERWSRPISSTDFSASGIRLRLPFGAVHPEFNQDWFGYGLVHVRLVAPGHGVFDDSRDAVRIRPWAPNRDQQELKGYPRFLPTEAVSRHY